MITGRQIREARRPLGWAQWRLAKQARVAVCSVGRAEQDDAAPLVAPEALARLGVTLESAGVEFIPEHGGGAGVRLRKPGNDEE